MPPLLEYAAASQYRNVILTVTLRFSPRFGLAQMIRALANSNAATAGFAGPSQSSAMSGRTLSTQTFGSSGRFTTCCHVFPDLGRLRVIVPHLRARGDREVGLAPALMKTRH